MAKVWNRRKAGVPAEAKYVGRPSKFGNPFIVGKHGTQEQCVSLYRDWVYTKPELMKLIKHELQGQDLVCWCAPLPCHADVLMEIANGNH